MKWNNMVMEEKINQKDYQFYVLNKASTKIRSGWSNKEDAIDGKNDDEQSKVGKVVAKATLKQMNIDPDDNKFWSTMDESKSVAKEDLHKNFGDKAKKMEELKRADSLLVQTLRQYSGVKMWAEEDQKKLIEDIQKDLRAIQKKSDTLFLDVLGK